MQPLEKVVFQPFVPYCHEERLQYWGKVPRLAMNFLKLPKNAFENTCLFPFKLTIEGLRAPIDAKKGESLYYE